MNLIVFANDLLLLSDPIFVALSIFNIDRFTSSGFLCLSKTHIRVLYLFLIKINNLMLATSRRLFSNKSPVEQSLKVMCGEYDIKIKSYSKKGRCFYQDIL